MEYLWIPLVLGVIPVVLFLLFILDFFAPITLLLAQLLGLPQDDSESHKNKKAKTKKSRWGRLADKWEAENRDPPQKNP